MEHELVGASRLGRWHRRLENVALVFMVLAAGVLVYVSLELRSARLTHVVDGPKVLALPTEPISVVGAASKGADGARVVMILFSDFQCPFCARFAKETLPELERTYVRAGKVRLLFRHFPLSSIHPNALSAAESAWCAGQQGRFWDLHDQFFENPTRLDDVSIRSYARTIELDIEPFDQCRAAGQAQRQLAEDRTSALRLGVRVTPTFLFGVQLPDATIRATGWLTGAQPLSEFERQLDDALKKS